MKKIILAALPCALLAAFAAAHGPHRHRCAPYRHGHLNKGLNFSIDYLDPWGHTVADSSGLHYYHDEYFQQSGGQGSPTPPSPFITNEAKILPARFFGTYPLYYSGTTMNYTLTLQNESRRKYKNIVIRAYQEYLNPDGSFGHLRLGSDAQRDFPVAELKPGETVTFNGSIAIPSLGESGLDQTDIIVFKQRRGPPQPGNDDDDDDLNEVGADHPHRDINGKIIFREAQVGIWCPPNSTPTQ